MPGMIRSNKKGMKIAYKILKTPKAQQQKNQPKVSEQTKNKWFKDSSTAQ